MGELKIRELRSLAEKELGERFDIRKVSRRGVGKWCCPFNGPRRKHNPVYQRN